MCEKCGHAELNVATRTIHDPGCAPLHEAIKAYVHCGLCLKELPPDQTPGEWARLNVGFTPHGLQIFCRRHNVNVAHFVLPADRPVKYTAHAEAPAPPALTGWVV